MGGPPPNPDAGVDINPWIGGLLPPGNPRDIPGDPGEVSGEEEEEEEEDDEDDEDDDIAAR